MTGRPITDAEVEQWLRRRLNRESWRTIAIDAKRDRSTVEARVKALAASMNITLPLINPRMARSGPVGRPRKADAKPLTKRQCLSCGAAFLSEGAHNRLCNRCRADPYRGMTRWV